MDVPRVLPAAYTQWELCSSIKHLLYHYEEIITEIPPLWFLSMDEIRVSEQIAALAAPLSYPEGRHGAHPGLVCVVLKTLITGSFLCCIFFFSL